MSGANKPAPPPLYAVTARRDVRAAGTWDRSIHALLQQGYAFLGQRFSDDGCVFRGMAAGFGDALSAGVLGHFPGGFSMSDLEVRLGVYFISNEPADALTAARLWEDRGNAVIAVLPSPVFNMALVEGRAGVLGFAEGGQVFCYPFLCAPPRLADSTALIVSPAGKARYDRMMSGAENMAKPLRSTLLAYRDRLSVLAPDKAGGPRALVREALAQCLRDSGLAPAALRSSDCFPRAEANS